MSITAIVATPDRDAANAAMEAAGHGPNNFRIPLAADGAGPATYWCFGHSTADIVPQGLPVTVVEGRIAAATASLGLQIVQPEGI